MNNHEKVRPTPDNHSDFWKYVASGAEQLDKKTQEALRDDTPGKYGSPILDEIAEHVSKKASSGN